MEQFSPTLILFFILFTPKITSSSHIYDGQPLYDTSQLLTTSDQNPLYCLSELNCQAVAGPNSKCHLGQCICEFGYQASSSISDTSGVFKNSCTKVTCKTDFDCTALFSNSRCSIFDGGSCICKIDSVVDVRTQTCRYSTSCEGSSGTSCFGRFGLHSECCNGKCGCKIGYRLSSGGNGFGTNECIKMPCTQDYECQNFWEHSKCWLGGCDCDLTCQGLTNRTCTENKNGVGSKSSHSGPTAIAIFFLILAILVIIFMLVWNSQMTRLYQSVPLS